MNLIVDNFLLHLHINLRKTNCSDMKHIALEGPDVFLLIVANIQIFRCAAFAPVALEIQDRTTEIKS